MRTTVELPPDLMKQAKSAAASRGESLKSLLTRAVATELGKSRYPQSEGARVKLPLFGDPKGKPIRITAEEIARALAEDDLEIARKAIVRRRK
jgi:hypothetical protein